jgi:hypothetical protein
MDSVQVGDMVYIPESTKIWRAGEVRQTEIPANFLVVATARHVAGVRQITVLYEGERWALSLDHTYPPKEL